MIRAFSTGVSALQNFEQDLNVTGNNIANINTTAFKRSEVSYGESFYDTLRHTEAGAQQVGGGVRLNSIQSDFAQGGLESSERPTDVAISGDGFFLVRDPDDGDSYATRAGDFGLDTDGYLVTGSGLRVQGLSNGDISFSATSVNGSLTFVPSVSEPSSVGDLNFSFSLGIGSGLTNNTGGAFTDAEILAAAPSLDSFSIGNDGLIRFNLSNGNSFNRGQLLLTDFAAPEQLVNRGDGLYSGFEAAGILNGGGLSASANTPGAGGLGRVLGGMREGANVDLTQEMTRMITVQRSFQAGARLISTSDEILQEVVNLKR